MTIAVNTGGTYRRLNAVFARLELSALRRGCDGYRGLIEDDAAGITKLAPDAV